MKITVKATQDFISPYFGAVKKDDIFPCKKNVADFYISVGKLEKVSKKPANKVKQEKE